MSWSSRIVADAGSVPVYAALVSRSMMAQAMSTPTADPSPIHYVSDYLAAPATRATTAMIDRGRDERSGVLSQSGAVLLGAGPVHSLERGAERENAPVADLPGHGADGGVRLS